MAILGACRSPRDPRGVQVGQRWFQTTGTMSHTMPEPSQVALWALSPKICKNKAQNDPKIIILGCILGVSGSQGPPYPFKLAPGHWYTVPHYVTALPAVILGFKIPNLVKCTKNSHFRLYFDFDSWDMLSNFCFHIYAQKCLSCQIVKLSGCQV